MHLHHRVCRPHGLHSVWCPTLNKCGQSALQNILGVVSHLKKSHELYRHNAFFFFYFRRKRRVKKAITDLNVAA